MAENDQTENRWKSIKSWVVGVTSVLVVAPALINAGLDLYNTVMKIPRTNAEQHNTELFAKHFKDTPVVSLPVPVRQGAATYDVHFSIYEEGDVYVEYGNMTQWFPFPQTRNASSSPFNPIATAYADDETTQIAASYTQSQTIEGDYLIRKKAYADGLQEKQIIDIRSGRIIETKKEAPAPAAASEMEMAAPLAEAAAPPPPPTTQVISPFAVIDLNAIKAARAQQATATTCKTSQGNCTLLHAVPVGSECICPSSDGEIKGKAQ